LSSRLTFQTYNYVIVCDDNHFCYMCYNSTDTTVDEKTGSNSGMRELYRYKDVTCCLNNFLIYV